MTMFHKEPQPRTMRPEKSFELHRLITELGEWFDTLEEGESIPYAVLEMCQKIPEVCEAMATYAVMRQATGEWPKCEHQEDKAH